jgi:BirA family biotin operon repressor/biotin-[acetyl-CoA-carboxylase] ligase
MTGSAVPTPGILPADLAEAVARMSARLGPVARRVLWFDAAGSTNDIAVSLAERAEPEGTVVMADQQLAGRGRLGRSWESPAGAGLYVSVIFRPPAPVPVMTLAAGVALARALKAATGLSVDLKWPNDVYVGGRKLAGILSEAGVSETGHHVVVGFGINVLGELSPEIAGRATTIEAELGRPVDRALLLAESLAALNEAYADVVHGRAALVLRAWRELASRTLGRPIEWDDATGRCLGVARDIDETGALVVDTVGGRRLVVGGEVKWR